MGLRTQRHSLTKKIDKNTINIQIFKNEIKDKLDDLAKSQVYVSKEEFDALKILSTRLEERIKKLEELLRK